jgi:hypothetical protein
MWALMHRQFVAHLNIRILSLNPRGVGQAQILL